MVISITYDCAAKVLSDRFALLHLLSLIQQTAAEGKVESVPLSKVIEREKRVKEYYSVTEEDN